MDFEDILLEVGDYGPYQKHLIWFFLIPAAAIVPWFTMNLLFMVSVPDHWCNVPEVVESNINVSYQRSLISPPGEQCRMYDINFTQYLNNAHYEVSTNMTTKPCNQGFYFVDTHWDSTIATKWNLVCDDAHYTSLILTLFNVGSILGTPIYGTLSDKIGRKITFFITVIITAVTSILSVLMTNFIAFVVIKTINGSLMPTIFQLPFIIILEIVAPEMRTRMNGIVNSGWTIGLSTLPVVAYLTRNWITLGLVTSSISIIFFLYWKFLPESPRWLISQERYDEATKIMSRIAETNGRKQDETILKQKLQKIGEKLKKEKDIDGVQNSSADLLRYPELRKKFLIITICWTSNIMAYYGLQLNVSNLAGNEFVNFFLLSVVEFPGYLTSWYVMEKFGRRWCTTVGFNLVGIICMLPAIDVPYMDVVCSIIGKYFAAGTFMATYQQSSELYPTVVRSLGMGMSSTVATTATLIVPYLVFLSIYGKAIPFIIIGFCCIIAGILASFLPETLNENLPQSIFEAEDFGKQQKFFSWNRRRKSVGRERAASMGLSFAGSDKTIDSDFQKDGNMQRLSQILQNLEIVSGYIVENNANFSGETNTRNPEKMFSAQQEENSISKIATLKTEENNTTENAENTEVLEETAQQVEGKENCISKEEKLGIVNAVFVENTSL